MGAESRPSAGEEPAQPGGAPSGKNLGNFRGVTHSRLEAHFQAAMSGYSTTTYNSIAAFMPNRVVVWLTQIAKYLFQPKLPFRDYASEGKTTGVYPIDEQVSISLAGDWGTGTDEARVVAASIEKSHPDFTIHLGDVYYVGGDHEVRENFLGEKTSPYTPVKWPIGAKGGFALSGNHEMYVGGTGYQRLVLPRMGLKERDSKWGDGQLASFFCLENSHWRIIGLDTAYNSTRFEWAKVPLLKRSKWLRKTTALKPKCTLPDPLLAWIESTVDPDGDKRGLILLSHHGPHSGFEGWYQIPSRQLAKLIHQPVIWFWGHEHRLAVYDRFSVENGIDVHGRCIGHGGMPVERGAAPDIPDCRWLAWDNRRYVNDEPVDVGFNGYTNFSFNGPALRVSYHDLSGSRILTEDWHIDIESGELTGPGLKKLLDDPLLHFREG
jgi:hypothetical protein